MECCRPREWGAMEERVEFQREKKKKLQDALDKADRPREKQEAPKRKDDDTSSHYSDLHVFHHA